MLYEIKNGTVSLGGNEILSHFNFRMVDNEKIGIVGRNGAGKTTLLKLMNGDIGLDYNDDNTIGEIVKSKDYNVGFLRQQLAGGEGMQMEVDIIDGENVSKGGLSDQNSIKPEVASYASNTVYQYLLTAFEKLLEMERKIEKLTEDLSNNYDEKKANDLNVLIDTYNYEGGETYIKELKTGFRKFGFNEYDLEKQMSQFSGGQTTKISLLKLLLSKPDVLLLDEPTNHLDIEAIEWMENYLKNYKKNVIVVSHDRMFLDNICNVIYDVENKILERYDGNYTDFVEQKEINYQLKLAEYNKNLKEIERLTALADRFRYKATKAKMVQSKDKVIEKLEAKTFKPLESDMKTFHVKIVPRVVGGRKVLRCNNLVVGYEGARIACPYESTQEPVAASYASGNAIATVNVTVSRRDRLAVLGANGTGKSTFIKTIAGVIKKISGTYEYGHEIEFEYFDQRITENNSKKTVFEDFADEFPTYTNTEVRNRLGRFLFGEEDIDKRICDLSGGEKVRLCLSKIFERKPNLLILDEPTNHLDILGKESLEEIINSFEGTVIFVSHDRYFVKKIANKVLYFEKNINSNSIYTTHFFEFGYDDYEKYIKEQELLEMEDKPYNNDFINNNLLDEKKYLSDKDETVGKDNYEQNKQKNKDKKKAKKIEDEIAKIENEIKEYKVALLDEKNQSDFEELTNINNMIEELNIKLEKKYSEWDELLQ